MIGLIVAIILFNLLLFIFNIKFSKQQIAHIWMFTAAFQAAFDIYIDIKYQGYWYFTKSADWASLPTYLVLVQPVNVLFLNYYPFQGCKRKKIKYVLCWEVALLIYELITLLPEPWGYFHYGWWNLFYSALVNPLLLYILVTYYKHFIK